MACFLQTKIGRCWHNGGSRSVAICGPPTAQHATSSTYLNVCVLPAAITHGPAIEPFSISYCCLQEFVAPQSCRSALLSKFRSPEAKLRDVGCGIFWLQCPQRLCHCWQQFYPVWNSFGASFACSRPQWDLGSSRHKQSTHESTCFSLAVRCKTHGFVVWESLDLYLSMCEGH